MRSKISYFSFVAFFCFVIIVLQISLMHQVHQIFHESMKKEKLYHAGFPRRFTDVVDCRALFSGDTAEIEKALKIKTRLLATDLEITQQAMKCAFAKHKDYITKPVSQKEAAFPIAISILMCKDVAQFEFLLRQIYRPQNVYCVHIDRYAPSEVTAAVQKIVGCFSNIIVASGRVGIVYGGFSRLRADLNCMKDLFRFHLDWKYLINLSGQMLPLKSNEEMVRILEIYNGANDIELHGTGPRFKKRFATKFIEKITNSKRYMIDTKHKHPPLPFHIKYVKGSAYGIFSRAFIKFVLQDKKAAALLEWSKNTYSPDEMFWSTLHHTGFNPHLKTPGGYNGTDLRHPWLATYAGWCGSDPCYSGKCVHGICIPGVKDLQSLIKRKEFTVNKFFVDFQPVTMMCLAERLWNKTFSVLNDKDFDYYRQLPFVLAKK